MHQTCKNVKRRQINTSNNQQSLQLSIEVNIKKKEKVSWPKRLLIIIVIKGMIIVDGEMKKIIRNNHFG